MKFTRECVVDLPRIRRNNVLLGLIETPILTAFKDKLEQIKKVCAEPCSAGRMGEPADIANTVTFLASENSSHITGTDIIVDGGLTISSNTFH